MILTSNKMSQIHQNRAIEPHEQTGGQALLPLVQGSINEKLLTVAEHDGGVISLGDNANDLAKWHHA